MNEDKLTAKEMQVFRLLHELRKILKSGEINIKWHEHDFVGAAIADPDFTGERGIEFDKFKVLLSVAFPNGLDNNS